MTVESRRERKKRETRERIAAVAFRLFAMQGFEQTTVDEIAEAADIARATLFAYYRSKESIILDQVGDDDAASVVGARPAGERPLAALRRHYRAIADAEAERGSQPGSDAVGQALAVQLQVIAESPTLRAGVAELQRRQAAGLAAALAEAGSPDLRGGLAAAQICAVLGALKASFFDRLASGESFAAATKQLPKEVDVGFDQLEMGLGGEL